MSHPIHEQIAKDLSWGRYASMGIHTPLFKGALNLALSSVALSTIDGLHARAHNGAAVTAKLIDTGEPLEIPEPGAVLKIVEDAYTRPAKPTTERPKHHSSSERFDELANLMINERWYSGPSVTTAAEGPRGEVEVTRQVLYLVRAAFGYSLMGKDSSLLGRGGNHYEARPRPVVVVGRVREHLAKDAQARSRISSAEMITVRHHTPKGQRHHRPAFASSRPAFGAI
jgi:hypothetical protein